MHSTLECCEPQAIFTDWVPPRINRSIQYFHRTFRTAVISRNKGRLYGEWQLCLSFDQSKNQFKHYGAALIDEV